MKIYILILFSMLFEQSCDYPEFSSQRNMHKGKLDVSYPYTNSDDHCMLFWSSGIYKGPANSSTIINDPDFLDNYDLWGIFNEIEDTIYLEQYGDKRKIYKSNLILTSDTSFILNWFDSVSSEFFINKSKIKPDSSKLHVYKHLMSQTGGKSLAFRRRL